MLWFEGDRVMEKIKNWCKAFFKSLKGCLPVTAVMAVFWLVLGWMRSFGIHSVILAPLNFFTGALTGLDGGSVIGGTIGKAVLLIIVNNFVRALIASRGKLRVRVKIGLLSVWSSLLKKIPQYTNIRQLFTKEYWRICINGLGIGLALIGYSFLTGNGSLQNSFVCVLLFAQFGGALIKKRGLIIVVANKLLAFLGIPVVERDMVNRLVGGNALGYAAATAWAAYIGTVGYAVYIGAALIVVSLCVIVIHHIRGRKAVAA